MIFNDFLYCSIGNPLNKHVQGCLTQEVHDHGDQAVQVCSSLLSDAVHGYIQSAVAVVCRTTSVTPGVAAVVLLFVQLSPSRL